MTELFPEYTQKEKQLKPFLKWAGGKTQLLNDINKSIPERILNSKKFVFIEPFVGSGAVLFHMLNSMSSKIEKAVINDINTDLINAYRTIQNEPAKLLDHLDSMSNKYQSLNDEDRQSYFLEKREEFNFQNIKVDKKSALLIFLNRTCFNGLYRVNSKGYFNVPYGRYKNPKIHNPGLILALHKALKHVVILNGDYKDTYKERGEINLFYFDPPYKPLNKTSSFNSYAKNGFEDTDQIRLKEYCDKISESGDSFILSNSDVKNADSSNEFFDDLYAAYEIKRVKAKRNINSKANKRGEIFELLVTNNNLVR
ncbi:Dam family site-specific DNA-(adenine-N6)-methyltransferase [Hyphobacterium sp. CCMP332]|nr:Dam family site-specific DNA-(adenine-N6)-methyltransferase [Hyphobacterium sp. CCMP332]